MIKAVCSADKLCTLHGAGEGLLTRPATVDLTDAGLCARVTVRPLAMGGLLGALSGRLLGQSLHLSGAQQYSNQTPVLSSNNCFDINRRLCLYM